MVNDLNLLGYMKVHYIILCSVSIGAKLALFTVSALGVSQWFYPNTLYALELSE